MMESRMRYRKKMKWMLRFSSWIEWELIVRACSQWMASGAPDFSYLIKNLRKDPHYWLYSNRGVLLWPYFVRPVQSSPNDPVLIPGLDKLAAAWNTTKREDSIHHWPTLYPHGAIRRVSLLTHPTDQTGKARSGTPGTKQAVPVGPNQKEEQLATPEQLQLRHRILTQLLEERESMRTFEEKRGAPDTDRRE